MTPTTSHVPASRCLAALTIALAGCVDGATVFDTSDGGDSGPSACTAPPCTDAGGDGPPLCGDAVEGLFLSAPMVHEPEGDLDASGTVLAVSPGSLRLDVGGTEHTFTFAAAFVPDVAVGETIHVTWSAQPWNWPQSFSTRLILRDGGGALIAGLQTAGRLGLLLEVAPFGDAIGVPLGWENACRVPDAGQCGRAGLLAALVGGGERALPSETLVVDTADGAVEIAVNALAHDDDVWNDEPVCAIGTMHAVDLQARRVPAMTTTATALCGDPAALVGPPVRLEVDFDDTAWRGGSCTAGVCDDDPACCNHCEVVFQVPCGTMPIRIRASAELDLAPTDFGPYEPMVTWHGTGLPGMATLGCLGCETGVSCSPADPATIRAVVGRIIEYPPPATGYELQVDAIEL